MTSLDTETASVRELDWTPPEGRVLKMMAPPTFVKHGRHMLEIISAMARVNISVIFPVQHHADGSLLTDESLQLDGKHLQIQLQEVGRPGCTYLLPTADMGPAFVTKTKTGGLAGTSAQFFSRKNTLLVLNSLRVKSSVVDLSQIVGPAASSQLGHLCTAAFVMYPGLYATYQLLSIVNPSLGLKPTISTILVKSC